MTEQGSTRDDLRAELERVDAELEELDRDIRGVRDSLTDGGPMDVEDRSAALGQVDELEAIEARLRQRREVIVERLGAAG